MIEAEFFLCTISLAVNSDSRVGDGRCREKTSSHAHFSAHACVTLRSLYPLTQTFLHTTGIRYTTECATSRLGGSSGHMAESSQVRPATNEDSEGIETVASQLPGVTASLCEGRTRHFADITDEEEPDDDETSTYLLIPTPHHAVPDQKPTWSPRSRLQPALTWRLEPAIAGSDFE